MKGNCSLSVVKDVLVLKVQFLSGKMTFALKAADDDLAFVQGFGRNVRNDVVLREENGVQYLSWCGLTLRKVKK